MLLNRRVMYQSKIYVNRSHPIQYIVTPYSIWWLVLGVRYVTLLHTYYSQNFKEPTSRMYQSKIYVNYSITYRTPSQQQQQATICYYILYGVATISRLLKMIGLFYRISSLLQGPFAKETCNFKEPTHRSHPKIRYNGILFKGHSLY